MLPKPKRYKPNPNTVISVYGSGHEGGTDLLSGFAIKW